jgi:hypothetical protein
MSSIWPSLPRSANTVRAAWMMRSRLRRASARSGLGVWVSAVVIV